jgi:hypothetical protein
MFFYREAGDKDMFYLHEAAEYLHRDQTAGQDFQRRTRSG